MQIERDGGKKLTVLVYPKLETRPGADFPGGAGGSGNGRQARGACRRGSRSERGGVLP